MLESASAKKPEIGFAVNRKILNFKWLLRSPGSLESPLLKGDVDLVSAYSNSAPYKTYLLLVQFGKFGGCDPVLTALCTPPMHFHLRPTMKMVELFPTTFLNKMQYGINHSRLPGRLYYTAYSITNATIFFLSH